MEQAIHLSNLSNLKYFVKNQYQRLYWGVEFCQNLIPSLNDTKKILKFVKKNRLEFSLVTPFVTERGLKKLNRIFLYLKKNKIRCEIIVNDWGTLGDLHTKYGRYFLLALGRLLVRQQRNPAMQAVFNRQLPYVIRNREMHKLFILLHKPPNQLVQKAMKSTYINSKLAQDFFFRLGVKRIELNNLIQGISTEGLRLKKSLYTPYVNISTTRFCPMESKLQQTYRLNVCHRECQKHYYLLRSRSITPEIYKRGNTIFYKNPLDIKELRENLQVKIDRIVYQPQIPS